MAGEAASMDPLEDTEDHQETSEDLSVSDPPDNGGLQIEVEEDAAVVADENGSKDETEPVSNLSPGVENGSEEAQVAEVSQVESQEPASPSKDEVRNGEASKPSERPNAFPLSRIKHIIKADPDVSLASSEAVFLLSKAAELFVVMMARDVAGKTLQTKRKTMQRRDIDILLDTKDCYYFLADVLDS